MSDYHEPPSELSAGLRDITRALNSFKEEIEAVAWYNQRVELATDAELKRVLAHNRDEEIEHAMMTLEWLRRNMPGWDEAMRLYLFTAAPITQIEEEAEKTGAVPHAASERPAIDLGIRSLKQGR